VHGVSDASRPSATPRVSFVIPVRNDPVRLKNCLATIAKCDYPGTHVELVVADNGSIDHMIRDQSYRGSRYSFGYPACPDLEDRAKLVDLLRPERIGVELSEELQLHPEQSTDAMVAHHPEAKYFNAG